MYESWDFTLKVSREYDPTMKYEFDSASPVPLYHRMYLVLRQRILEGRYPSDQPLPNELEIAQQSGVSRVTVRRAMERLASEALIERRRGRGTFVTANASTPHFEASLSGLLDTMLAMGLKTQVTLLEFAYVTPPAAIQRDLGIGPSEVVQLAVRVRRYKNEPLCHLTTYVPESVGKTYQASDLSNVPLLQLLEQAGVVPVEADEHITAKLADPDVAGPLNVELGVPLLQVTRITRDVNGRAVEHLTALFRPDRYEYHLKMRRRTGDTQSHWTPSGI